MTTASLHNPSGVVIEADLGRDLAWLAGAVGELAHIADVEAVGRLLSFGHPQLSSDGLGRVAASLRVRLEQVMEAAP